MKKKGTWYTYIVEAENGSWYTGISTDVEKRFKTHKSGKGGKYFKISPAKQLIMNEKVGEYPLALRREAQIKKLTRAKKERYAANPSSLPMPDPHAPHRIRGAKKKKQSKKKKV